MHHEAEKTTTRNRRTRDEVAYVLSKAQKGWLRPLLLEKVKTPTRQIPYKYISSLALFREFRSTRRLENLIRGELRELQRVTQVQAVRQRLATEEKQRAEKEREEKHTRDINDAVQQALEAQANEFDRTVLALTNQHAIAERAKQRDKAESLRQLEELRVIESRLRGDLESVNTTLGELQSSVRQSSIVGEQHEHELCSLRHKYHSVRMELEAGREETTALKAQLIAAEQATRSAEARESTLSRLHNESSLQMMAIMSALRVEEGRVETLQKELRIYRAGPELETRMRALTWALRRLPYEATMDDVRKEIGCAYVRAYEQAHRMTPRRLKTDVEGLVREWWIQRCKIAHQTDHSVDLSEYETKSRRLSVVVEEIDAALLRGERVRFSMGPLQFLQSS